MGKEIIIKLRKCVLVLYESELFSGLKTEILMQALKRGKSYRRAEAIKKREENGEEKGIENEIYRLL